MDKLKALYESYIEQGLLSKETSFEQFSQSDTSIQEALYKQGIDEKIISSETTFDVFSSAWDEKKNQVVSTSQEDATVSTTKGETTPTSLESSDVKVDPLTGLEYSPRQIQAIRGSFNQDIDLEDKNIKAAINSGTITDNDLIIAGYKTPETILTLERQPTPQEIKDAKTKIGAFKSKTKEEIDFFISQKNLDQPYIYEQYSSPETRDVESLTYSKPEDYTNFVDKYFDKEKLENANINIKDFDGFLEFKGLKKGFLKKSENFKSTYGSNYDPKLAMELELSRMIDLYVGEQAKRDIDQQKLKYQKQQGVDPDFTKDKYSFNISESNVNIDKITQYYEENMPIMTQKLKEVDKKNQKLYQRYLDGDIGAGYFLSELAEQGYEGFETRVQELSATASDILGFSRTADGVRLQMDQEKLMEGDNLSYSYVEGKKVKLDNKNYLVDSSGNIYDLEIKKRVTNFLDKKTREEILKRPGEKDFSFSATGTAYESANVVGDMAVQIGLQGTSGALLKGSSALMSAKRAKDIAKYIPIKRDIASSMLAQSTLGASSGYENTLKLAREAGIEENEARKLARESSIQMARLYALTAPISPQTKATQAIFGDIKKNTLKEAIKSYKNIGREGFLEVFEKAGRKATTYFEEGLKEVVQENIQQAGEILSVNKNINELAQTKLSEDVITAESFINTSILSFTAGMLMPGAGGAINSSKRKVRKLLGMDGVDRIEALNTLSKNKDKVKQFLNVQKDKGIYTQEEVDELISEINIYEENISKIPDNLSSKTSLEIIADINKISDLENKKKTLDPSFHEDIDKEISDIRESIKQKTKEDAIQEQKTGGIPDAKPAEGVQEVEEEVREPFITEKKKEKVSDALNRPITLTELGGSKLDTPIEGDMYVEGQQVVVEDADGNITEIGNVDEVSDTTLEDMGIVPQDSDVKTDNQGNLVVGEDTLVPDKKGIKKDKRGNISRVVLQSPDGSVTRTLRGANAEDAAYQILLNEAQSPEQEQRINELLEQDEEFQDELRKAEDATKAETDTDTEQVIAEESIASPKVTVEDAPDGTFLNIEMVAGKDGREMTQEEILDALPVDPLNVEVSGKTLVIQVPRELSNSEMMKLAKDTDQDAIPQLSNKKGVLHAQSQEKMDLYEGRFVPNLFIKPKKVIKDERPKAGNRLFNEPLKAVKAIADKYYKRIFKGERPRFEGVKKIDKEFAKRISDAFEAMQENPNDPEVKAAYEAMAKETMDQYKDFKDAGYIIEINNSEPYKNAQEMIDDLRDNKRMKIFSTESGFGDTPITKKQRKDNPLLRDSGVKDVNGETLLVNDIFRAVHDFYGHAELGNGFGPVGEENAWNVHSRMFSPLARRAMTTETRGQNSYVNFSGINDEAFKLRDQARKLRKEGKEAEAEALVAKVYEIMKFADQKVGLLPEEFSSLEQDGVSKLREMFKSPSQRKQVDNALKALSKIAPDVEVILHESEQAYAEATGETGRKQKTAGTYDETVVDGKVKKVIHINPDKANARTVAHESFHAILLSIVKTDAEAQRLTAAMIKAVYKSAPAELKTLIDNFAESKNADGSNNYDSALQNEEKLAELIGYLATEYDSLPKPTKNVIKRWLDRLAKMFGMKPFTDGEVIDVLNTIAKKVSTGEAITQEDVSIIDSREISDRTVGMSRKQLQDLFLSDEKPNLKTTRDVAKFLNAWTKESAVFEDDVKNISDREIVDRFVDHLTLELHAWEKVRKDDYISFYDDDVVKNTNPTLQRYAKKEYGRELTDTEVKLYHLVSAFASPSANPEMDSWKGFDIFDRFMKTGELSGYSDKIATVWKTLPGGKRVDTGVPRLDDQGKPARSKVTPAYSQTGLDKFNILIDKMGGDIDKAMEWITSQHSYSEISDMFGYPEKGPKSMKQNEYMTKDSGGLGVFGMTGAKLGSYILNRFGNFSTVTKDMWYARTMARLSGQDLTSVNKKTGKEGAIKTPWSESTKEGRRMRSLADEAFRKVGDLFNTSPAMVQERIWDFEKRLYEMLGANEDAAYTSDGLKKGIERAKDKDTTTRSRKQVNLAPNGKPSNLNQEQYDIVRTPEFKNWFGDWETDPKNASKVVDENGEPLVVYHGSTAVDIDIFDRSKSKRVSSGLKEFGTYFSTNKELSKLYAEGNPRKEYEDYVKGKIKLLKEAQLKARSNDTYNNIDSEIKRYNKVLNKQGEIYPVFLNLRKIKTFDGKEESNIEAWNNLKVKASYKIAQNRDAMEFLRDGRFGVEKVDGIEAKNIIEMSPGTTNKNSRGYIDAKNKYLGDAYLVFDSVEVPAKLADGSNTTFDPDAPSIRKQAPGRPSVNEIVRKGKENNISDADIRQFAKEEGYTDAEITAAMNIPSSEEIVERSEKAIKDKLKKRDFKGTMRYLRKKIFDRQTYIKDVLKGVGNKKSVRAHNRLVTKAGAKGFANYRFKKAEKEIFSNLSEKEKKQLDAYIYARRIVAINENRKKRGEKEYVGAGGYNYDKAKSEVEAFSNDKLSKRADKYFEVFNQNLKRLRDSGRISEDVYVNLRDIEYSPIKTIKYIIGDNHSASEINNLANSIGVSQKDIMTLSDENLNDLITDSRWLLMMNISAVENRSATNEVLDLFYDAINSADADGLAAIGDNILDNPIVGNKQSGAPKFKYDDAKVPVGYRTVSFFKDGVEYKMVMREEYARQLLDIKADDKTLKALRKFTFGNVLRFFATSGNPLFIVGNTAVDFQNILFLGDTYSKFKLVGGVELGFDFVKNSLKKIFNTGSYKKTYEEFMTYGGGMDFLSVDGIKAIKGISRFNKPKTLLQKGMVKWGEGLSYLGETSEMAFRLAVYEKTRSKLINQYKKDNKKEPTGQDLEDILYESARESRETIDFSQGGDFVKSADYVLPYLNASVQGARRAVDYASKNPGGFASNMIQYAVMSGGLLASSLYMLSSAFDDEDDEEEKAKKMKDAWASVSDYEKSAYHIIFTGDVDEDGEYEYYRFKKLPIIGLLSTTVEESIIATYLKSKGVDYKFNTESVSKALDKTSPIGITDLSSRNPVISGVLSYVYNKDTFTGEEIFRGPRGKKILPEAEGILDNKVEQIYKDIAPKLGMSPKRTQVMVEKVITNERTNPLVGVMYGGYNGVFSKETTVGEEMKETMNGVLKSFSGKIKRSTNSKLQEYKKMDEVKKVEAEMETEIYLKEQEVYNAIKEKRKNKEDIDSGFLRDIIKENFEKKDWEKYGRKFSTYAKNVNIDRSILDLIYEDTPEVQAYKIYSRYGDALDSDEKQELKNAMKAARRKLNNKALSIYNKEYRKK